MSLRFCLLFILAGSITTSYSQKRSRNEIEALLCHKWTMVLENSGMNERTQPILIIKNDHTWETSDNSSFAVQLNYIGTWKLNWNKKKIIMKTTAFGRGRLVQTNRKDKHIILMLNESSLALSSYVEELNDEIISEYYR